MIEKMITLLQPYLPLKITDMNWDETSLHVFGPNWSFFSLSVWRISAGNKIIFCCEDENSTELLQKFNDLEILHISYQNNCLKIDPVFHLSNGINLEIFSTDTYEPWTLNIHEHFCFIATPNEPNKFDSSFRENFIIQEPDKIIKPILLNIQNVVWKEDVFEMKGFDWSFKTGGAWRISTNEKVLFGCYDSNSGELLKNINIKNFEIIAIGFQTNFLKIDPVFILDNGLKIEIFSIITDDPWSFSTSLKSYGTMDWLDPLLT